MKQGRTIPELSQELCRQANAKKDLLAPANQIRVASNGHSNLLVNEPYTLNDVAHGQLAEYAGIPKLFYDRLRGATESLRVPVLREDYDPYKEDHPLFDVLVNELMIAKGQDGRLVRTLDGACRAFLSDTYNPDLDNYDVFRVAARVIEEQGLSPDNVLSCEVTEKKLYLKVVSPKLEAVVRPENIRDAHGYLKEPQVVQAGFILTNSEVGLGSLSVQQVVYKLMCTNLWVMETAYRQRHVGKVLEADDNGAVYQSDTRAADAKARLLKVRDHVTAALDEHKFMESVAKMQDATSLKLEGGIEKVVETTARKFALSQDEKEDVLRNLIEGADLSAWGLSNAVTATAATVANYDRATELEAIGGRLLCLPAGELKELARAA